MRILADGGLPLLKVGPALFEDRNDTVYGLVSHLFWSPQHQLAVWRLILERRRIDKAYAEPFLELIPVGLLHVFFKHMDLVVADVLQTPIVGPVAVTHPGHKHVMLCRVGLELVLAKTCHGWVGVSCGVELLLHLSFLLGIQALVGLTALLFFFGAEFGHIFSFR